MPFPTGPAIACCVHNTCLYGEAAEAVTCADAATQTILASSYDQSCEKDSDCVGIVQGNFCVPGAMDGCPNAAINMSALAQYNAELAKTQAGACYAIAIGCPFFGTCCVRGGCGIGACGTRRTEDASADVADASVVDAGDASGDAGYEAGDTGAE